MLFRELLIQELNLRREDFASFAENQHDELESYLSLLTELSSQTKAEVQQRLGKKEDVGAVPSVELDRFQDVAVKFDFIWRSHEEARSWALKILKDRTTFAADASQILPGREISLPVAAIQVGTFENFHNARGEYKKQAHFTVIPPNELLDDEFEEKPLNPETKVGLRRFQLEVAAIEEFLKSKSGWQDRGEAMPLAFFDGTLLISFSQPNSNVQRQYIETTRQLVLLSKETRVPLVGFIDQSYARDLVNLLDNLSSSFLHQPSRTLNDAQLINFNALKTWGDRSIFFYCQRQGLSDYFVDLSGNSLVGLVYLQTSTEAVPARLDVPSWIYETGLLEEVLDVVRAECITGVGYPYALETADATAVITVRDRETFLRALQDFAWRENLNFRVASKRMSKSRRR
jgi:hypothetical protein